MGLRWWVKSQKSKPEEKSSPSPSSSSSIQNSKAATTKPPAEVPGMNGAMEVPRSLATGTVSVFEFGSVAAAADKVTLAGYCPVSEDLEPCRWEILPAIESNAPQFRVVF